MKLCVVFSKLFRDIFKYLIKYPNICAAAGRRRLLQKKLNDRLPVSVSSPFSSQKRKSPSFDVNNNRMNNYAMDSSDAFRDGDVQELSNKLKKVRG